MSVRLSEASLRKRAWHEAICVMVLGNYANAVIRRMALKKRAAPISSYYCGNVGINCQL
jgi:hypothetical protein